MDNGNERLIVDAVSHAAHMVQNSFQVLAVALEAPHIIENPKFGLDGDQYYFLKGDNIQDGIAGFGPTPKAAAYAFNMAWSEETAVSPSEIPQMQGTKDALDKVVIKRPLMERKNND